MKNWLSSFVRFSVDRIFRSVVCLICVLAIVGAIASPAYANLKDDRFDGNIFALYGGNGSLVPPKVDLKESLRLGKPAVIAFYIDDSYDCKLYTPVLNDVQAYYGKAVSIIPIAVDSLDLSTPKTNFNTDDEAYYYRGFVPQTVVLSPDRKVLFDLDGKPDFADLDAALRQIPGLSALAPNVKLRNPVTKQVNEVTP
ncbi:thylakoid membrane photosystem I accumulation factor [Pseudanabaena sp. PCC 6802]|uniref:thylakoid membrane photosystem I accumulation factor n=1 Tax=Pseudanabaena sp. PCC 6802 TaxID=118173 RepID=UPI0003473A17|nr:thylakoid membrane photosystem I accumulation factor [Pseudanabaena sp. PCC 6802]